MSLTLRDLEFTRPETLQATVPPELRGGSRDAVRLLVSTPDGHHLSRFPNLANFLAAGDLVVVNRSATLPASLPAQGRSGPFVLNLSTHYGTVIGPADAPSGADQAVVGPADAPSGADRGVWLAEPRRSHAEPGPVSLRAGETVTVAGLRTTFLHPYPGLPRLWFVRLEGDVAAAMERFGTPIRYGYVHERYPLRYYQTLFADRPGSAEMPSAARPFTEKVLACLRAKGVELATITLHTGVSSLEVETENVAEQALYPEPFEVPTETVEAVETAKVAGGRVIAVGTTVVRALESAWDGLKLRPAKGFTRLYLHPGRAVNVVDGLLTGFHDPKASHLAMLYALAGQNLVRSAYDEAVRAGLLWHEFGDSHLILPKVRGGEI